MINYAKLLGLVFLAAAIGITSTACEGTDNSGKSSGQPSVSPPALDGSWHSKLHHETFTFDVTAKTFLKMDDDGWGERGTFTWNAEKIICSITHVTTDGVTWNLPPPDKQIIWPRTYSIVSSKLIKINNNDYLLRDSALETGTGGKAPYRILSIGASFTRDSMRYMRDILIANGVNDDDITIVNAYIGGQTLAGHASCAENGTETYVRQSFGINGEIINAYGMSSKAILESNDWDIVSFQQGAAQAGNISAYNDTDIAYLIKFVKDHCPNPNVKIAFHMTWAYNSKHNIYPGTHADQMAMYSAIVNAVKTKIVPKLVINGGDFSFIQPSGTAFQNARTIFGDTLNISDNYHANDLGRFIAGATWLRQLYGEDMKVGILDSYQTLSLLLRKEDITKIEKCVEDAIIKPFEVTDQN